MTDEPSEPSEPLEWTLRTSVDGAQRLIHAWKDGRLEKTLGFPIVSLLIHTPFAPGPGGGDSGPPDDDSRPITLLPWEGISVAGAVVAGASGPVARADATAPKPSIEDVVPAAVPTQERGGSGAKKKVAVAAGLVAAVLLALWLARLPDEPAAELPPPEAAELPPPAAAEPRAGGGRPSSESAGDSRAGAAGVEGSALEEAAAEGTGSTASDGSAGTGSDTMPDAPASQTTEPGAAVPGAPAGPPDDDAGTPRSGDGEAGPRPAEGVASADEARPAKPRKGSGGGGKPTSKEDVAPKPPKEKALYSHYRCVTEGAQFEIVLHARSEADAKADACNGTAVERRTECIRMTKCERTQ